jgi:hypothetical protein
LQFQHRSDCSLHLHRSCGSIPPLVRRGWRRCRKAFHQPTSPPPPPLHPLLLSRRPTAHRPRPRLHRLR